MVPFHAAVIHDAGDALTLEQDVIVPDVTQAGLKGQFTAQPWSQAAWDLLDPAGKQLPTPLAPAVNRAGGHGSKSRAPTAGQQRRPGSPAVEPAQDRGTNPLAIPGSRPGVVQMSQGHAGGLQPSQSR